MAESCQLGTEWVNQEVAVDSGQPTELVFMQSAQATAQYEAKIHWSR